MSHLATCHGSEETAMRLAAGVTLPALILFDVSLPFHVSVFLTRSLSLSPSPPPLDPSLSLNSNQS